MVHCAHLDFYNLTSTVVPKYLPPKLSTKFSLCASQSITKFEVGQVYSKYKDADVFKKVYKKFTKTKVHKSLQKRNLKD